MSRDEDDGTSASAESGGAVASRVVGGISSTESENGVGKERAYA